MKHIVLIIIVLSLFQCRRNSDRIEPSCKVLLDLKKGNEKIYKNKISYQGDSFKIEFIYKGDTTIEKIKDLKGVAYDGFDSSYDIFTVWNDYYNSELNCEKKFLVKFEQFHYFFCQNEALKFIYDTIASTHRDKETLNLIKDQLIYMKHGVYPRIVENSPIGFRLIEALSTKIPFTICDTTNKNYINKIRIGKYTGTFFGGYHYLILNRKGDTIHKFKYKQYIK